MSTDVLRALLSVQKQGCGISGPTACAEPRDALGLFGVGQPLAATMMAGCRIATRESRSESASVSCEKSASYRRRSSRNWPNCSQLRRRDRARGTERRSAHRQAGSWAKCSTSQAYRVRPLAAGDVFISLHSTIHRCLLLAPQPRSHQSGRVFRENSFVPLAQDGFCRGTGQLQVRANQAA